MFGKKRLLKDEIILVLKLKLKKLRALCELCGEMTFLQWSHKRKINID